MAYANNSISKSDRATIRQHADDRGCRYMVTKCGEVHYYGTMTNSRELGWHFKSHDASEWAEHIREGRA